MTEQDKIKIKSWKLMKVPIKRMAELLGLTDACIQSYLKRQSLIAKVGEKVKISKQMIKGVLARRIHSIIEQHPRIPLRDIPAVIAQLNVSEKVQTPIPSWVTIHTHLKTIGTKFIKIVKKPFISEANVTKRLLFAKNSTSSNQIRFISRYNLE